MPNPKVTVTAHLPKAIKISDAGASDALTIEVRIAGSKKGTFEIGRGAVRWWRGNKNVNAHCRAWKEFIDILEEMPLQRKRKP